MSILHLSIFLALAALLTVSLWPMFQAPAPPEDEGIALVYPEMFMKGRYPYRDFETIYGPGNLLVLSGAYSIFGLNIFVERTVGLVYRLSILLGIFAIARRWGSVAAIVSGVLAVILLSGELFANTWLAALAFALIGLCLTNVRSRWRSALAGFFAAFAALCRCDLGPAIIIAFLPLFLLMRTRERGHFLIGGALGLLPLIWFAIVVGPAQLVHSLFLFPVIHLSSAAYFPISSAAPEIRALFYFFIVASAINLVAAVIAWRRDAGEDAPLLLGAALFGAAAVHYALSRFDSGHVVNAVLVSIPLLPVSATVFVSRWKSMPRAIAAMSALAGLVVFAPWTLQIFYHNFRGETRHGTFVENDGRTFPLFDPNVARSTTAMLRELARVSLPHQRVLVGPGDFRRTVGADTFIYHLLPRLEPGTYYLEMNPGSTNAAGSRLASDVANSDWLIMDRGWDSINEPNRSSEYGSDEPNEIVRQKFDFWAEYGPYVLMRNHRLRNFLQPVPEERHQ